MKKRIIIMMYYMHCGGVERALVDLLKNINPAEFEVDLFFLEKKGELLCEIPEYVNQLELDVSPLQREMIRAQSIKQLPKNIIFWKKPLHTADMMLRFAKYKCKHVRVPAYCAAMEYLHMNEYDIALDFHGYLSATTFVLAKKVKAKKKFTWIHSEMLVRGIEGFWDYLQNFDGIFCVSEVCRQLTTAKLPRYPEKAIRLFPNFLDTERILSLSKVPCEKKMGNGEVTLLTVGRLDPAKGYDMAIDAAQLLVQNGVDFRWYFCGEGDQRSALEEKIQSLNLQERVILLGYSDNPYAYMKNCDIYVQTSMHEGYGLTVLEALLLGCAVISTPVPCALEEIQDGDNGLIVEKTPESIADGIQRLIRDKQLLLKIKSNHPNVESVNRRSAEMLSQILEE